MRKYRNLSWMQIKALYWLYTGNEREPSGWTITSLKKKGFCAYKASHFPNVPYSITDAGINEMNECMDYYLFQTGKNLPKEQE